MSEYQSNTLAVVHKRATRLTIIYRLIYLVELTPTKILYQEERARSDIAVYTDEYVVDGSIHSSGVRWNITEYQEMLSAIRTAQNNNIELLFKSDVYIIAPDNWLLESVDSFVQRAEKYLMLDML